MKSEQESLQRQVNAMTIDYHNKKQDFDLYTFAKKIKSNNSEVEIILQHISKLIPKNVWLTDLTFTNRIFVLAGFSEKQSSVIHFRNRIDNLKIIKSCKLTKIKHDLQPNKFSFEMIIKENEQTS